MILYSRLNIPDRSDIELVEAVYKELVRKHFVLTYQSTESILSEINAAYAILKIKKKKKIYDMFGDSILNYLINNDFLDLLSNLMRIFIVIVINILIFPIGCILYFKGLIVHSIYFVFIHTLSLLYISWKIRIWKHHSMIITLLSLLISTYSLYLSGFIDYKPILIPYLFIETTRLSKDKSKRAIKIFFINIICCCILFVNLPVWFKIFIPLIYSTLLISAFIIPVLVGLCVNLVLILYLGSVAMVGAGWNHWTVYIPLIFFMFILIFMVVLGLFPPIPKSRKMLPC
ncbi:Chaperone protein DnaJ 2 [Astathelohania contejeani]|uniref:Chaperone protein DnaJ 2 n=1 Tax=Astathelohania contejeani TaxID=164912 RepID=A0ABQ7I165_9MICR|nr:Chaperone protein DnaJ 2 [Thelohania contejeani]